MVDRLEKENFIVEYVKMQGPQTWSQMIEMLVYRYNKEAWIEADGILQSLKGIFVYDQHLQKWKLRT